MNFLNSSTFSGENSDTIFVEVDSILGSPFWKDKLGALGLSGKESVPNDDAQQAKVCVVVNQQGQNILFLRHVGYGEDAA